MGIDLVHCDGSDAMSAVVEKLYASAHELNQAKADNSAFTVADGLVQHLLAEHLFKGGQGFKDIVGEEDSAINLKNRPYTVSSLEVPHDLFIMIDNLKTQIDEISATAGFGQPIYEDCSVFIDPIDGTREFSSKKGEQCSIMVGFAIDGKPVAGLVYRPLTSPKTWALGCAQEGVSDGLFDEDQKLPTTMTSPFPQGLLTTNGGISEFTSALLETLGKEVGENDTEKLRVRAGGAGNKVLNLLEGKGQCYIQDRGVSRWDTCAPQAVLESRGGLLCKLADFVVNEETNSYKYAKTTVNQDFGAAPVCLTPYNKHPETSATGEFASCAEELKPYANVQGLVALSADGVKELSKFKTMCKTAAAKAAPRFD